MKQRIKNEIHALLNHMLLRLIISLFSVSANILSRNVHGICIFLVTC